MKEKDRNTGFFFQRKASNRRRKNAIYGLFDAHGHWFEDDDGLEHVVTSYFSDMFLASAIDVEAMESTLQAIQPFVTEEIGV